jgi:hypothetical protein
MKVASRPPSIKYSETANIHARLKAANSSRLISPRVCARAFVQRLGPSHDWQGLFAFCRLSSYVVPAPAGAQVEAVQSETVR